MYIVVALAYIVLIPFFANYTLGWAVVQETPIDPMILDKPIPPNRGQPNQPPKPVRPKRPRIQKPPPPLPVNPFHEQPNPIRSVERSRLLRVRRSPRVGVAGQHGCNSKSCATPEPICVKRTDRHRSLLVLSHLLGCLSCFGFTTCLLGCWLG